MISNERSFVEDYIDAPVQVNQRRKEVPEDVRKQVYQALLTRSNSGILHKKDTQIVARTKRGAASGRARETSGDGEQRWRDMASGDGKQRAAMASSADDRVLKNRRDTKESLADWAKRTRANGRERSRGGRIYSRGVIMKAQRDLRRGKNVPNNPHAAMTTSFVLVVCSRTTTLIPVTEGV